MKDAKVKRAPEAIEAKEAKKRQQLAAKEQKAKKRQARKDRKAKKDPNKPKRAPTAFFLYLEEFRKDYKKQHPDVKGVAAVGKACGDKWKEMNEEEKAPFVAKAAQKRAEYEKALSTYSQKKITGGSTLGSGGDEAEESEKSKSEVHDEDEDSVEEEDDEE